MSAFKLDLDDHGCGLVELDGEDISKKVTGVTITMRAGYVNEVTLTMLPAKVAAKLEEAEVTIKEIQR